MYKKFGLLYKFTCGHQKLLQLPIIRFCYIVYRSYLEVLNFYLMTWLLTISEHAQCNYYQYFVFLSLKLNYWRQEFSHKCIFDFSHIRCISDQYVSFIAMSFVLQFPLRFFHINYQSSHYSISEYVQISYNDNILIFT